MTSGVSTTTVGTTRRIVLCGEITDAESADFRTVLVDAIMRERPAGIVVDLSAVTRLDDTALGALLAAADITGDRSLWLEIRCDRPSLVEDLRSVGFTGVITSV
jgi:anti-anti-sigma regulatory factor